MRSVVVTNVNAVLDCNFIQALAFQSRYPQHLPCGRGLGLAALPPRRRRSMPVRCNNRIVKKPSAKGLNTVSINRDHEGGKKWASPHSNQFAEVVYIFWKTHYTHAALTFSRQNCTQIERHKWAGVAHLCLSRT